jgi:hypothetical protein
MATMAGARIDAGLGRLGNIFVYPIVSGQNDDGVETRYTFEVRMGAHTIATKDSESEALEVARLLQVEPDAGQEVPLSETFSAYVAARRASAKGTKIGGA